MTQTTPPDWALFIDQDRVADVPLHLLHESPTNYRQRYNDASISELAEDIKGHGRNLQPLLARPIWPELFRASGDFNAITGLEIVYGHRRFRALQRAGLPTGRVEIRMLTDLQVKRMQLSENLQREDVHPIEEAEGFHALIDEHGETAESIAESIGGPSKLSLVYSRLRLLKACPAVRKSCVAGEIGSEVALLIARVGPAKLQEKALARIASKYLDLTDGGAKSSRQIKELLKEEFTLDLGSAMFDPTSAELLPDAGACTPCPKRTENDAVFADVAQDHAHPHWKNERAKGQPNRCTDPDCFAAKTKRHLALAAQKLNNEGKIVIEGNKARAAIDASGHVKGAYIALSAVKAQLAEISKASKKQTALTILPPTVVHIQNPRDGKVHQAVAIADLKAVGVKLPEKELTWHERYALDDKKREESRLRNEEKAKAATLLHIELLDRVRSAAAGRQRDEFDLRLVTRTALAGVAHNDRKVLACTLWKVGGYGELLDRVDTMPVEDLHTLLLDCALVSSIQAQGHSLKEQPENMFAAAKHYGVSLAPPGPVDAPASAVKPAPSPVTSGAKRPVMYRCPMTEQTWSGRGLQPKWLKVAIQNGAKLSDFEFSTPSPAARAQTGAAAKAKKPASAARGADSAAARDAETAQLEFEAAADAAAEGMQSSQLTPADAVDATATASTLEGAHA